MTSQRKCIYIIGHVCVNEWTKKHWRCRLRDIMLPQHRPVSYVANTQRKGSWGPAHLYPPPHDRWIDDKGGGRPMSISLKKSPCLCQTGHTVSKDPRTTSSTCEQPLLCDEIQYCIVSVPPVFISRSSCQTLFQILRTPTNQRILVWEPPSLEDRSVNTEAGRTQEEKIGFWGVRGGTRSREEMVFQLLENKIQPSQLEDLAVLSDSWIGQYPI